MGSTGPRRDRRGGHRCRWWRPARLRQDAAHVRPRVGRPRRGVGALVGQRGRLGPVLEVGQPTVCVCVDPGPITYPAGSATSVRLSFRALDVSRSVTFTRGSSTTPPCAPSTRRSGSWAASRLRSRTGLERARAEGDDQLVALLKGETGKSPAAITKALAATPDPDRVAKLLAVCDNDPELRDRVLPFLGLVRDDLRDDPRVFLPGARRSAPECRPSAHR